ncbi:NDR1/HIN1-like protein 3 [Cajanus cajan]|uniref:Syntaxin-24 n=1 Tax=Cajanus cajan TaxID=3821 RepID=A0A151S2Q4_CAJCA|nr:NDR1/HIN1-like protein 3 [Cajanus cajan]KYP49059.1 Putative syntaxin-24 [Cajanus cajan]
MDDKQAPPDQPRRRGRRWCYWFLRILWILFVCIIVFVVLVILVLYSVIQPRPFKFQVSEARLTEFNYSDDGSNTLRYNLVLNFTAINPNKMLSIYYDKVEGHVLYGGVWVDSTHVVTWNTSFRQYTKSTDPMNGRFWGRHVVVLDASDFERDKRNGVFNIDLRLNFGIRLRLGDFIAGDMKPRAQCGLKVPFVSNETAVTGFRLTQCDIDF